MFDSFIKACQAFFTQEPNGKKVDITEFKALTVQDRIDLSTMLNATPGFEHPPYVPPRETSAPAV